MSVSFNDLVFHNPTSNVFEASYYFPNNYVMIVKTELVSKVNSVNPKHTYFVIHPNKYSVNIMQNGSSVITSVNPEGEYHFQTESEVSHHMKHFASWLASV
jgi:TFIIF-interacting CTD phosphatase-like protein